MEGAGVDLGEESEANGATATDGDALAAAWLEGEETLERAGVARVASLNMMTVAAVQRTYEFDESGTANDRI